MSFEQNVKQYFDILRVFIVCVVTMVLLAPACLLTSKKSASFHAEQQKPFIAAELAPFKPRMYEECFSLC